MASFTGKFTSNLPTYNSIKISINDCKASFRSVNNILKNYEHLSHGVRTVATQPSASA